VNTPTVLELFAGIGGLTLGLERAGFHAAGFVEIDPFCRSILAAHWPEVPQHDDVRTATAWWGSQPRPVIDLIAGGFPCQPVSRAGLKRGTADPRWMWPAMAGSIRDLRPRYALMENVTGLLAAGMGCVLGDLAALGYDAEWDCVPASAVGAHHQRDRVFILAYPQGQREELRPSAPWRPGRPASGGHPANPRSEWPAEPSVGRMAHGIPRRVDRLRTLGNAVVPAVAEHVGRVILHHRDARDEPGSVAA
jgi:DNA (cytosine-5)-methyltransferase 1